MGKMVRRKTRHSRHSEYAGTYRAICELRKEKETFLEKASIIGEHIENLQDSVKEQIKLEIPSKAIRLKMKINLCKNKQREKEERVESIIRELDRITQNIHVPSDSDSSSDDEDGPDPNAGNRYDDSSSDKQDSCSASDDSSSDEEPLPQAPAPSDDSNSDEDEPLAEAPAPTSDTSPPRCDVSTVNEYHNPDGTEDDSAVEGNDYSTESDSTSTNEEPPEEEITLHWYETDMMDDL